MWESIGYKPHIGQMKLHSTIEQHTYTQCVAGRGGGKTEGLSVGDAFCEFVRFREATNYWWEFPRYVLLIAPLLDQAEINFNIVQEYSDRIGIPLERDRSSGKLDLITYDGSRIRCMSANNPQAGRGFAWNRVYIDESASVRKLKTLVNEILKPTIARRKGKIVLSTTPDAPGSITEENFLKGLDPSIPEWGAVRFTALENTYIEWMGDFIDSERRAGTPEDIIQREYFAQFIARTGVVYQGFGSRCVRDFARPENGKWFRACDWGFTNPFACLKCCLVGETLYVWDEIYVTKYNDEEKANLMKADDATYSFDTNIADDEDPAAIDQAIKTGCQGSWIRYAKPNIIERIDTLRKRIARGAIVVHPRCRNLIREAGLYRYPSEQEMRNESEKPMDKDNHALDALGYLVDYLFGRLNKKPVFF